MTPARTRLRPVALLGLLAMFAAARCGAAESELPRELIVCADPSNLPFSNQREEGFENRIAGLIAADLHATLRYTWNVGRRSFLRRTLFAGECDVVMGVPAGLPRLATTRPYYTSTYVFVSARGRHLGLHSFDDPTLPRLTIGLHAIGADGANTPPAAALARRGIVDHIVGYPMWGEEAEESPPARIVDAVAAGEIDTAIVWGPFAGYFARNYGDRLTLTAVDPDPTLPALTFSYAMAIGVRPGEDAFKAKLQDAVDRHREEIATILKEYGVPLVPGSPGGDAGMPAHAGE